MKIRKTFFLVNSISFLILLLGIYSITKTILGCEYCFRFRLFMSGNVISYIDIYMYQYAIVVSVVFGFIVSLFIEYYARQKIIKRIIINIFLIQLLTLLLGGFLLGILFSIHDMNAGFYPGFSRFISNCFEYGFTAALFGIYIIMKSLPVFGMTMFIVSVLLVEVLRVLFLKKIKKNG